MSDEKKSLIVFLDLIGRTVIGEKKGETEKYITVQNPAVVNITEQIVPGPDGNPIKRMALQLFPLFFREFLATRNEPVQFNYKKDNITMPPSDIALDFKVGIQYEQLFNNVGEITSTTPPQAPTQPTGPATPNAQGPVRLFDDQE